MQPVDPTVAELLEDSGWIRRFARRLVGGDEEAADDLVQDTWLAALEHRPSTAASARPWLARVLTNLARQGARRRGSRPASEALADDAPGGDDLTERAANRAELQARLVHAVLALREPFRSTLLLRYYEGLSADEIAQRAGVPDATVRTRLKRGLDQLRARFDREHGGERRAWALAFLPLARDAGVAGILATKTVRVAAGAAALLLVAVGVREWTAAPAPGDETGTRGDVAAAVPAPPPAPRAEPTAARVDAPPAPVADERRPVEPAASAIETPGLARAPWRVLVTDAATGEPVPHYAIEITAGEAPPAVETTGANGWLKTRASYPAQTFALRLLDHPEGAGAGDDPWGNPIGAAARVYFDPERPGESDELRIAVGPTYRLRLSPQELVHVAPLHASFVRPGQAMLAAYLRDAHHALVRFEGDAPWVRFPELGNRAMLPPEAPWVLELTTRDGLVVGTAEVATLEGIAPMPAYVELERRARLTGRVLGPVKGANVALTPIAAPVDPDDPSFLPKLLSEEDGAFDFPFAPAGGYVLEVRSARHAPFALELELPAGEAVERDVEPVALPIAGDVSGRLTSTTGSYRNPVVLFLRRDDVERVPLTAQVEWTEVAGRFEAAFAFRDVPAGRWTLSLHAFDDDRPWSPPPIEVEAPADGLLLECRDGTPAHDFGFLVVDADTGDPIERFHFGYTLDGGGQSSMTNAGSGGRHLRGVPAETDVRWAVSADGYETAWGDASAFDLDDPDGGSTRFARVALRPGWSVRVRVSRREEPVAGALLRGDGVALGRTDRRGALVARADAEPAELSVELEDGTVVRDVMPAERPDLPIAWVWVDVVLPPAD